MGKGACCKTGAGLGGDVVVEGIRHDGENVQLALCEQESQDDQ